MKHEVAWYQEHFGRLKIDFQTRRNRAENEALVFMLASGPCRVTYMSVDESGVVICATPGVNLYAAWNKGDRFEHMYDAIAWMNLPEGTSPPVMAWDSDSAWEVTPPLKGDKSDER